MEDLDFDLELAGVGNEPLDTDTMALIQRIASEEMKVSGYDDVEILVPEGGVGAYDIIGAKGVKRVSAAALSQQVNKLATQKAGKIATRFAQLRQPTIRQSEAPENVRTAFLSLSHALTDPTIASGAQAIVRVKCENPFTPVELFVAGPEDWMILDFKIGTDSYFASTSGGGLPAEFFARFINRQLKMQTGRTSQEFTIAVLNRSAAARRFLGGIQGYQAR